MIFIRLEKRYGHNIWALTRSQNWPTGPIILEIKQSYLHFFFSKTHHCCHIILEYTALTEKS